MQSNLKLGINGLGRIGKLSLWHHTSRRYFIENIVNIGRAGFSRPLFVSSNPFRIHGRDRNSHFTTQTSFLNAEKNGGIDFVKALGRIQNLDQAQPLFEKRLNNHCLSRIRKLNQPEIVIKIANAIIDGKPNDTLFDEVPIKDRYVFSSILIDNILAKFVVSEEDLKSWKKTKFNSKREYSFRRIVVAKHHEMKMEGCHLVSYHGWVQFRAPPRFDNFNHLLLVNLMERNRN